MVLMTFRFWQSLFISVAIVAALLVMGHTRLARDISILLLVLWGGFFALVFLGGP